ncbi:hypothetical protein Glove_71g131 [Diversispora epigaea]|uniref:Uncharacterized protein n=1 Tax=Diversispora epigaea TaxID=1348612 RepID=A0A397JJM5_9GLOM|nr:hypothetical protein Glove_71g131 [Diversispora epigaea]
MAPNKSYFHTSVYLDSIEKIDVQELRIEEREFVLKVSVPSTKCSKSPKSMTLHWPNNVNVFEGTCRALYVLGEKKHIVAGHENVNQMKYLIEYEDEDNNRSTKEISKSDLHHAILCIQERGDSTEILKCLIDYYADNTKEYNNVGWMFTVSKAIPLLYDNNLTYTPPLHINLYDQKKGNNAEVIHSLVVKPCLAPKFRNTIWFFLKNLFTRIETSCKDRKVYIVPLPNIRY